MVKGRPNSTHATAGWHTFRSDAGRHWATRVNPFPDDVVDTGEVSRTVEADTPEELAAEIARQERRAAEIRQAGRDRPRR